MKARPTFAIVGHPNEGKSSIVATLAQDDSIAISATPGETVRLQRFDLKAGGATIIQFVDTPGFQNPQATLAWFRANEGLGERRPERFIAERASDPDFHHDCELLRPVVEGAGILYVVDGSRPIASADLAEMEILRLTARPRMAIINAKTGETRYLDSWKSAFRQHFNSVRAFNAQTARYVDRIELLDALKSIDQDWAPALGEAIELLKLDRARAVERAAEAIAEHLEQALTCKCSAFLARESGVEIEKRRLEDEYRAKLQRIEERFRGQAKDIFQLRRVAIELPENSILREDLFSERSWQALGLTQRQLAIAGGLLGAGIGAGADVLAAGVTFGVFASLGAAFGVGSALLKGKDLARAKISHMPLGGLKITVGPNVSEQFPFVQLDRDLLFAQFAANWAHARRETAVALDAQTSKAGPASQWSQAELRPVTRFVQAVRKGNAEAAESARRELVAQLAWMLAD